MKLLRLSKLNAIYNRTKKFEGLDFLNKLLDEFEIKFEIPEEDFKNINKTTQDILDNKFPKIPYNHNICGICEFKNYCWGLE